MARYLYDVREIRRTEFENVVEGIQFFQNPTMFRALYYPEEDMAPEGEISEEITPDEFEELDKMLSELQMPKQSQEVINNGEWI